MSSILFLFTAKKTNKTWKNCSLIDNKTQLLKHLLITIKTSVQQRQVFHYRINMTHMRKNAHRIDQSLLNIKISLADLKKKGIVLTCIATRCANTIRIIWSHYLCSTRVTEFPSIKWLHIRFYYGQSQISSPLFFCKKNELNITNIRLFSTAFYNQKRWANLFLANRTISAFTSSNKLT